MIQKTLTKRVLKDEKFFYFQEENIHYFGTPYFFIKTTNDPRIYFDIESLKFDIEILKQEEVPAGIIKKVKDYLTIKDKEKFTDDMISGYKGQIKDYKFSNYERIYFDNVMLKKDYYNFCSKIIDVQEIFIDKKDNRKPVILYNNEDMMAVIMRVI